MTYGYIVCQLRSLIEGFGLRKYVR